MSLKIYKLNVKHGQRGVLTCSSNDNDCINGIGTARNKSPPIPFIYQVDKSVVSSPFTTIRELAPLFSPNRHGTCEAADNLSFDQVGIRLPSFLPYRRFKRKRIVKSSQTYLYKSVLRMMEKSIIIM